MQSVQRCDVVFVSVADTAVLIGNLSRGKSNIDNGDDARSSPYSGTPTGKEFGKEF